MFCIHKFEITILINNLIRHISFEVETQYQTQVIQTEDIEDSSIYRYTLLCFIMSITL